MTRVMAQVFTKVSPLCVQAVIYGFSETASAQGQLNLSCLYIGCDAKKHVFGVSDEVSFKPACSAADILLVASQDKILSNKQITNGLIRLQV